MKMGGDNGINEPIDKWTTQFKEDNPDAPILHYRLQGLKPDTHYQVEITARNDIGWSMPNAEFIFETSKGRWRCFMYFLFWLVPGLATRWQLYFRQSVLLLLYLVLDYIGE